MAWREHARSRTRSKYWLLQRLLTVLLLGAIAARLLGWSNLKNLPPKEQIRSELLRQPSQQSTDREPFTFTYRGTSYIVRPLAEYDIWGLLVSHNNPYGFADIYHDEDSVDTRDLGLIWGSNVRVDDYRKGKFWNTCWMLYYRGRRGLYFNPNEISNNHLITASDDVRKQIAGLHVGDQIHIRGMLVGYADAKTPKFERKSSVVRNDTGNGACEVIFVEKVEILKPYTRLWLHLFEIAPLLVILAIIGKIAVYIIETREMVR